MPRVVVRSRLVPALFAVLALAAVAIGVLGGPPAEAQRRRVLNIAAKEPDSLDPHTSTIGQSQATSRFMYRGLTRFAIKDGRVTTTEFEPDLAESWTISPDGTQWTFKLRRGVQFHKGFGELTAEDVKFSFERQIKRAPGTRFGVNLEVIKDIEVIDPYTVQISLKAYDPLFLLRMVGTRARSPIPPPATRARTSRTTGASTTCSRRAGRSATRRSARRSTARRSAA